jgi:hypothetical protein
VSIQTELLAEIEAFLPERGITDTTFGRLAVNDWKFVDRLRGEGTITLTTVERVRGFIAAERQRLASANGAAA